MEKEFPRNYSEDVVRVLEALSLDGKGKNLMVVGSASLRSIQYAADYDANDYAYDMSSSELAARLKDVIRRLQKIPDLAIGDIKCGMRGEEPIRWKPAQLLKGVGLVEAIDSGGMIKIDTASVVGTRYVEIGCVYVRDEGQRDEKTIIAELEADTVDQVREKDYWKALKRIFSLARLREDNVRIKRLTDLFNGDLGRLYSVLADIKLLIYLIEEKKGDTSVMKREIDGFRARLSNIFNLPEFIKAEPGFDDIISSAAEKPTLALLNRLAGKFNSILQEEAEKKLAYEVR